MTAVAPSTAPARTPTTHLIVLGLLALILPSQLVDRPELTVLGLLAPAFALIVLTRPPLAVALLVAASPFENWLSIYVNSNTIKALGAIVIASAMLALLTLHLRQRSAYDLRHPALTALTVLMLLVLLATIANPNGGEGLQTTLRYFSFGLTCAVMAAIMREGDVIAQLMTVFVLSSTAASAAAIVRYVTTPSGRAGGPLDDPNDFGFFLAVAIALGTALALRAHGRQRTLWWGCVVVLLGGMALTLSRGAILALFVALVWALAQRHVRLLPLLGGVAVALVALAPVALQAVDSLQQSLEEKQRIGSRNVETRTLRWQAAGLMTLDNPLLGVGPAGFRQEYVNYALESKPDDATEVVSHQMYLEISAELGIPGLLAFLTMLGLAWRALRRASLSPGPRAPPGDVLLARGVQGGILVTVTASMFLTEQYYLPIWMLTAAAVALEHRSRGPRTPTALVRSQPAMDLR